MHINNMLIIGSRSMLNELKSSIGKVYLFKDMGEVVDAVYIGIHVKRN